MQHAGKGIDITQSPGEHIGQHRRTLDQVELLKNHADLPANLADVFALGCGYIGAIPKNIARGWFDQPVDASQECRFTGSAQANDRQKLAIIDFEADVL